MTIVASKLKAMILNFIAILAVSFVLSILLPSMSLGNNQTVVVILALSLIIALLLTISSNDNIEIDESEALIGGSSDFTYRKEALYFRFRKQHFIAKDDVDLEKSLKQGRLAKLLGEYKFYDSTGRGFKIKRYLFSTEDFNLIKTKIFKIYGVEI